MTAAWGIALAIVSLYFAYDVLMPIALSVLLAFLLAPIVARLERRGLPQVAAVLATVLIAFSLIGGLTYVVGMQVYSLGVALPDYQEQIGKKVETIKSFGGGIVGRFTKFSEQIEAASTQPAATRSTTAPPLDAAQQISNDPAGTVLGNAKTPPVTPVPTADAAGDARPAAATQPGTTAANPLYTVALDKPLSPLDLISTYLGKLLGPLGTAGLVVVFVIFVLLEREQMRDRLIRLVSGGNYTATTAAINDATARISRYMVAQSIVNGSYGLTISAGLWLIGLYFGHGFPSFVLWGLLCAILRFIPYIGPWVAAAFPVVLSLAVYGGFDVFFAVLGMFVLIELFSNNVMEPWLYGSSTGLSTVAILVAAVFWTWLWGPVGLLLSTPLTVCIVVMGRHTAQLEFLDVLLSDRPALPPPVRFYQRLLAGDEREATQIAVDAAGEHGWTRAADEVVVPALALVRRDRRQEHLDGAAEAKLIGQIRELATRFAVKADEQATQARDRGAAKSKAADGDGGVPPPTSPGHRVLAFPSHHRGEEAVLRLLPLGLADDAVAIAVGSTRQLAADVVAQVERERPAAVVIGIVPPGGVTQTRYLCRRLKRALPDLPIVVVYFGRARHFDKLLRRLRSAGASYVTTSIGQTQSQLLALVASRAAASPAAGTLARGDDAPKFVDRSPAGGEDGPASDRVRRADAIEPSAPGESGPADTPA